MSESLYQAKQEGYHKEFSGQQEGETLEFVTPLHWITTLPYFAGLLAVVIAFVAVCYAWMQLDPMTAFSEFAFIVITAISLVFIHIFFIRLLNYFFRVIVVSNFRVLDIHRTTVLKREKRTVDFATIQDIEFSQRGIIQRIFDYGTISIQNATGEKVFHFHFVPKPEKHYNILNHIYRKAVDTSGSTIHNLSSHNERTREQ
jgi:membrane protein YdbS with pleckstrin-like domain